MDENSAITAMEENTRRDLKSWMHSIDGINEMMAEIRQLTPREVITNIRNSLTKDGVLDVEGYIKTLNIISNMSENASYQFISLVVIRAMGTKRDEAHVEAE